MSSYISSIYQLSTNPKLTCNLSYEVKREGNFVYYRFKVQVGILYPNTLTFPYDLKVDITLNSKKILSGGALKNIQPSKWTVPFTVYFPHQTGWYQVDDFGDVSALPCTIRFYSTQTTGSAMSTGAISVPPYEKNVSQNIKVKINGVWKNASNVYVKVNGIWKQAENIYVKINGVWRGS